MSNGTDNDLVQATLSGHRDAFDELVGRYERRIFNVTLRVTGDPQDAMDATQTAFLKAYRNLRRFDPKYKFFSWIYRIGVNEALNLTNQRRWRAELDHEPPARRADPEQVAAGQETGRAIRETLAELTPDYRAVIVLRHIEGLTYQEMAEVLDIPVAKVKSRLFTARQRLRTLLLDRGVVT